MSSHLADQDLVAQLATEHPQKILPAFGLHPWWSHCMSFAETVPPKRQHYEAVFPGRFLEGGDDEVLLNSFPEPVLVKDYLRDSLRPRLLQFPRAMLGEVGLDKAFRIPHPARLAQSDRADASEKRSKRFTDIRTPVQHQLRLLRAQLEVAFELDRNISIHCVHAQGPIIQMLADLPQSSKHWNRSTSKLCMHSYGGSVDSIKLLRKLCPDKLYFSFSATINGRLDRLEQLIETVPHDRLLIESDYNDLRQSEVKIGEILQCVGGAKKLTLEQTVSMLESNWKAFGGPP